MELPGSVEAAPAMKPVVADPCAVRLEPGENVRCSGGRLVAQSPEPWMKLHFINGVPAGRWIALTCKVSMRNARSYFSARQFPMQDKDILYVSNAPLNELDKLLILVGRVTSVVTGGAIIRNQIRSD
jgi:hypothetical protein